MKFNKLTIFASGLCLSSGLALGFYLSGNKNLAATVGISSVGGAMVCGAVSSQHHQKKIKGVTDDSKQLSEKLNQLNSDTKTELTSLQKHHRDTVELRDKAIAETKVLLGDLASVKTQLSSTQLEKTHTEKDNTRLQGVITQLNQTVESLQQKVSDLEELIEDKEAELEEFNRDYKENLSKDVEIGFQKRKKEVIAREIKIDAEITSEAIELMQDYKDFVEGIMDNHYKNRELLLDTNEQAKTHIQNLVNSKNEALISLQEYNDRLQLDNAALQQQINGEILAPEKVTGKHGRYYLLANNLIDKVYEELTVCLKFTGLEERENSSVVGYGFSKSANPQEILEQIKVRANTWANNFGIHTIENIKLSKTYPAIEVTFVKDAPKVDETSLYRSNEEFKKMIVKSRIFLRLMGKPESGKTPTALCIADWLCREGLKEFNTGKGRVLPHTVIAACNPLKGISRKSNSDLDVFTVWNDNEKAFKGLINEYEYRRKPENANYKDSVGYIWLFDEYDNAVRKINDKSLLTTLPEVLSDGGHINMGAIVLGQGGNVSKLKIQAEDVKLFKNIILDAVTMKSFLEKYGDLYYDDSTIADALKTIDQLEKLASEKNKTITDTARKFRYCMVLNDRSPVFYQLPYFDQTDIDGLNYSASLDAVEKIKKGSMSKNTQNTVSTNINPTSVIEVETDKPPCKYCGSPNVKRNGKHPKTGNQQYTCNDCKQSPRKWTV